MILSERSCARFAFSDHSHGEPRQVTTLQLPKHSIPIKHRHAEVKQEQVWRLALAFLDRLAAVAHAGPRTPRPP